MNTMSNQSQNDMRQMTGLGRKIENDSFGVIDREVGPHDFDPASWEVVRRVIHATADFEFKDLMRFSPGGVKRGVTELAGGATVLADVNMILAGLNRARLESYGCKTECYISDPDVIDLAKARNSTRAIESMRKAHRLGRLDGSVLAVGNAPTALIEAMRLVSEEGARPALVIGVPVGFISAAESKEIVLARALEFDVPYIVASGRKGGSTIAVAIIHALLLLSTRPV